MKTFEYLSASSIKDFLTCKRKFFLTKIEGIMGASSLPMSFGSMFHEAVETGTCDMSMIDDEYYNQLLMDNAVKAYNKYRDALPMQPDKTMREVCFQLNSYYKPIIGYIDVVDQYKTEMVFGDCKTTRRNAGAHYLDSVQYKLYTLALHGDTHSPFSRKRRVEVVALRKGGKVDVEAYSDFCGDLYLKNAKSMLIDTLSEIALSESANFWPSNMDRCSPQAGEGWKCGFNDLCRNNPETPVRELARIALESGDFEEKTQKNHKPVFEGEL